MRFWRTRSSDGPTLEGVRRSCSSLDILRVQDSEISGADDPTVLEFATGENGRLTRMYALSSALRPSGGAEGFGRWRSLSFAPGIADQDDRIRPRADCRMSGSRRMGQSGDLPSALEPSQTGVVGGCRGRRWRRRGFRGRWRGRRGAVADEASEGDGVLGFGGGFERPVRHP